MHTIGIDFGTTKTLVSRIVEETGRPETVRLGQGTDYIPTSVFIKDNGDMLFGDEADDRLTEDDGVYLRGFKMSLGNSTPVYAQMNDEGELIQYMAAELVTRYLSYIRTRVQETVFSGEPITRAIITRPVEFSPARCEELRQAAIAAGFAEVELTTEPEAAGLAFCRLNDARAFRHSALIVDWGGGTLDFALVTREDNHIIPHPNLTAGDVTMGGERFDYQLWSYAESKLRKQGIHTVNPVSMLPIVRKNKERLSASDTATLRLSHEHGTCPPIELTQQLFNTLIKDSVERAAGKIMQLLERIPEADKPEMLLLVGGSCRIPYIKCKLEEICKLPAVSWHLSREAVSLGAALWDSQAAPAVLAEPATPAGRETADVSIPEKTTEQNSATQDTQTKPTHKRALNKVAALGTLLAAAVAAPLVYTHFIQMTSQTEIDEESQKQKLFAEKEQQFRMMPKSEYTSQLLKAAKENDIILLTLLLNADAYASHADENGLTPLHWAAMYGHNECVKLLRDSGAAINSKSNAGWTPLHMAAMYGHSECMKHLLKGEANVNERDYKNRTPLHMAAIYGHSECVKHLLKGGADVNKVDYENRTPLFWATKNGHTECKRLLEAANKKK